jgi:hypothetical protein
MTRDELLADLLEATSRGWHWWAFHFQSTARGQQVPFASALIDALLEIDAAMPGYAARTATAIGSLTGREKHLPDYEQLLQRLAEVHVALQTVRASWPEGSTFVDEPVAPGSARNPEVVVSAPGFRVGVEVKAPALLDHEGKRSSRRLQSGGRIFPPDKLGEMAGGEENLTLPRDNPVKDFLVSANQKFAAFHADDADFFGILAIVWDDFIYEPITALLHPSSGLLTENSFARAGDGTPLRFEHVDGILLISHLQYLKRALGEDGRSRPFVMSDRAFEWDIDPARPVAYVDTPSGKQVPEAIRAILHTTSLEKIAGAEYQPSDWITWIDTKHE